jgi:hypothetical protein
MSYTDYLPPQPPRQQYAAHEPYRARGRGPPPGWRGPPRGPGRAVPTGFRGAPSAAPRVDLSAADTSAPIHNIYVKITTPADPDHVQNRDITLATLKYVASHIAKFREMGISVKVNKVTSASLKNVDLRNAMKKRGITRLPALTTPNNVYIGYKEIVDIYNLNTREFAQRAVRGEKPVEGALPDDEFSLDNFYKDEMTFERAEDDAQEAGIGEVDDMMDSYRGMMERREKSEASRRKPGAGRPPAATAGNPRAPPKAPTSRPDNVGSAARRPAPRPSTGDIEDDEIQATIDSLAADIDEGTRKRAFSSGGGDSLEDDGGSDIQDDLMERAYYANALSSDF